MKERSLSEEGAGRGRRRLNSTASGSSGRPWVRAANIIITLAPVPLCRGKLGRVDRSGNCGEGLAGSNVQFQKRDGVVLRAAGGVTSFERAVVSGSSYMLGLPLGAHPSRCPPRSSSSEARRTMRNSSSRDGPDADACSDLPSDQLPRQTPLPACGSCADHLLTRCGRGSKQQWELSALQLPRCCCCCCCHSPPALPRPPRPH